MAKQKVVGKLQSKQKGMWIQTKNHVWVMLHPSGKILTGMRS